MDMLQQVIHTFKLNVLAVENVPESIRPLINLQEVLPFYRFTDAFNAIGWCKRRGIEEHQDFSQERVAYLNVLFMKEG